MRKFTVPLFLLCSLSVLLPLAEAADPPKGFTSIFNGKDLTGWHGMGHFNPDKLNKMSAEDRAKNRAAAGCLTMISMISSPSKFPFSPRNSFSP